MGRDQSHRANLSSAICHTIRRQPTGRGPLTDDKWGARPKNRSGQNQLESNSALSHGTRPIAQGQSVIGYLSYHSATADGPRPECQMTNGCSTEEPFWANTNPK